MLYLGWKRGNCFSRLQNPLLQSPLNCSVFKSPSVLTCILYHACAHGENLQDGDTLGWWTFTGMQIMVLASRISALVSLAAGNYICFENADCTLKDVSGWKAPTASAPDLIDGATHYRWSEGFGNCLLAFWFSFWHSWHPCIQMIWWCFPGESCTPRIEEKVTFVMPPSGYKGWKETVPSLRKTSLALASGVDLVFLSFFSFFAYFALTHKLWPCTLLFVIAKAFRVASQDWVHMLTESLENMLKDKLCLPKAKVGSRNSMEHESTLCSFDLTPGFQERL